MAIGIGGRRRELARRIGRFAAMLALLSALTPLVLSARATIAWPDHMVDAPNAAQPTPVDMTLYLDDLSRIEVFAHTFRVTGQLMLEWRDERLVPLLADRPRGRPVAFAGAEVTTALRSLWHPELEISNEQGQRRVGVRSLELYPDGRVKLYEKFDSVPRLEGDMHLFPFVHAQLRIAFTAMLQNRQELELRVRRFEFGAGENAETVIVGHWDYVSMTSEAKLLKRSDAPDTLFSRADFVVTVKRLTFSGFATFVLPMILIALVSIALLWLDAAAIAPLASPRVGGMITLILTSVALQLTLRTRLPNVHYQILTDYLFYLTIIMLTLGIFQSSAYIRLFQLGKKELAGRIDRATKIGFPLVYLVLALAAFFVSLARVG